MDGQQQPHTVSDIACTQCGCVCDDLTVQLDGRQIRSVTPHCGMAESWFLSLNDAEEQVPAEVHSRPVQLAEALDRAADLLRQSRAPLIYGLSRSTTAGQRAACELADYLGANIDTTASTCHAPSIMALQQVGECTSTLGEVRNRSDLVIYWGSNPLHSHPRHFERVVEASGRLVPGGRQERHVVVVDVRPTATSAVADTFLQLEPGSDFEVLWALRLLIAGQDVSDTRIGGVPLADLRALAHRLRSCRYGAVFFGLGLTQGPLAHQHVEALLQLVTDLQQHTRFVARRMRVMGDVAGADSVLCWQTGFPFSVSLNRRFPRYNPGEFTASSLLARGEVDCLVLVGAEGLLRMSADAQAAVHQIPTILLDYPNTTHALTPTIRFRTAIYGVHRPGIAYRMDEVPIRLRAFLKSALPSDDEVLQLLLSRIRSDATPVADRADAARLP